MTCSSSTTNTLGFLPACIHYTPYENSEAELPIIAESAGQEAEDFRPGTICSGRPEM